MQIELSKDELVSALSACQTTSQLIETVNPTESNALREIAKKFVSAYFMDANPE